MASLHEITVQNCPAQDRPLQNCPAQDRPLQNCPARNYLQREL